AYTLDLSTLQGRAVPALQFAVVNAANRPADELFGTFSPPTGSGFVVTGNRLPSVLRAGQSYDGLYFTLNATATGTYTETLTFHPTDVNDSGYSGALPDITLTVIDPIEGPAQAQVNTPSTIIFPNVHVGGVDSQAVSISNTATPPAAGLDVIV